MRVRCPSCEVKQAKAIAFVMLTLKRTPNEVCAALTERFGVPHYVDFTEDGTRWRKAIVRSNSASPANPLRIRFLS